MLKLMRKSTDLNEIQLYLLEQIRTIDKQRLNDKITHLDEGMMEKVDEALQISLGLIEF